MVANPDVSRQINYRDYEEDEKNLFMFMILYHMLTWRHVE